MMDEIVSLERERFRKVNTGDPQVSCQGDFAWFAGLCRTQDTHRIPSWSPPDERSADLHGVHSTEGSRRAESAARVCAILENSVKYDGFHSLEQREQAAAENDRRTLLR